MMNRRRSGVAAMAMVLAMGMMAGAAQAAGEGWTTDMDAAMKTAASENKHILMDFTGSDWCGWCIKLKNEVFTKDHFKSEAPKKFVLVELDFPRDKSKLSKETIAQNNEWRDKLKIRGYPTIILADAEGKPYAKTGYRPNGPEAYISHLNELSDAKAAADKATEAAKTAEGVEKAKLLDQIVDNEMLIVENRDEIIEQIVALDGENKAGLKKKYEGRLLAKKIQQRIQTAVYGKLRTGDAPGAIAEIDKIISELKPEGESLFGLLGMKAQLAMRTGDFDLALKSVEEMAAAMPEPEQLQQILLMKHEILKAKGDTAAADKALDEAIAAAPDSPIVEQIKAHKAEHDKDGETATDEK